MVPQTPNSRAGHSWSQFYLNISSRRALGEHENLIQKAGTTLLMWHATSEYKTTDTLQFSSLLFSSNRCEWKLDTSNTTVTPATATAHLSLQYTWCCACKWSLSRPHWQPIDNINTMCKIWGITSWKALSCGQKVQEQMSYFCVLKRKH